MKYGSVCEKGKRPQNQDGMLVRMDRRYMPLAAVSDGMGGHLAGDAASALSLQILDENTRCMNIAPQDMLARAYVLANDAVLEESHRDPHKDGMGATLVSALFFPDHFIAANVGDSRLYSFKQGVLRQVTYDHSYVQELVCLGYITKEQAKHHPKRNLITRCIGSSDGPFETDLFYIDWKQGDSVLLCSDGLSGVLEEEDIQDILSQPYSPQIQCEKLAALALKKGSTDNITALIVCNDEEDTCS